MLFRFYKSIHEQLEKYTMYEMVYGNKLSQSVCPAVRVVEFEKKKVIF